MHLSRRRDKCHYVVTSAIARVSCWTVGEPLAEMVTMAHGHSPKRCSNADAAAPSTITPMAPAALRAERHQPGGRRDCSRTVVRSSVRMTARVPPHVRITTVT